MENGGLLLAAFSSFFFSVTSLLAKKVGLPPLVLSWFGFLGLTVLSAPLFAIHRKWSPPPKAARLVLLRSVVGTLFVILSFCAVERIPIGDASVLFYTAPVFTVGLAYVFLGEPCPPHGLPLIVALMAGVVLVTRPPALFGGGGGRRAITYSGRPWRWAPRSPKPSATWRSASSSPSTTRPSCSRTALLP